MKIFNIKLSSLLLGITLCFTGCAQEPLTPKTETIVSSEVVCVSEETQEIKESANNEKVEVVADESSLENWGQWDDIYRFNNEWDDVLVNIKVPTLGTKDRATGKVAYQEDNTLVILDGQIGTDSPVVEGGVSDVLVKYMGQLIGICEMYREDNYSNFAFEIQETELMTVNEYEMCKYKGLHTFTYNDVPGSMAFVAYSTQLSNGAYMYWMVLDETKEQSLCDVIDSHATNMAYSLNEDN